VLASICNNVHSILEYLIIAGKWENSFFVMGKEENLSEICLGSIDFVNS